MPAIDYRRSRCNKLDRGGLEALPKGGRSQIGILLSTGSGKKLPVPDKTYSLSLHIDPRLLQKPEIL